MKDLKPDLETIRERLLCNDPGIMKFAIKKCVIYDIKDTETINIIKELKNSKLVEQNSIWISDCAYAALDMLGIERYTGTSEVVKEYIDTCFYQNIED